MTSTSLASTSTPTPPANHPGQGLEPSIIAAHPNRSRRRRLVRAAARARAIPRLGTWIGLFCVLTGFGLIVLGWGRTAHLAVVALQLPYLLSAGLTGLGLVVTGVTLVSWDARLADSRIRSSQLDEMRALMSELNRRLDSR